MCFYYLMCAIHYDVFLLDLSVLRKLYCSNMIPVSNFCHKNLC